MKASPQTKNEWRHKPWYASALCAEETTEFFRSGGIVEGKTRPHENDTNVYGAKWQRPGEFLLYAVRADVFVSETAYQGLSIDQLIHREARLMVYRNGDVLFDHFLLGALIRLPGPELVKPDDDFYAVVQITGVFCGGLWVRVYLDGLQETK